MISVVSVHGAIAFLDSRSQHNPKVHLRARILAKAYVSDFINHSVHDEFNLFLSLERSIGPCYRRVNVAILSIPYTEATGTTCAVSTFRDIRIPMV